MGIITDSICDSFNISSSAWTDALQGFLKGEDLCPMGTASGAMVTPKTALSISAVYACIRLISWTMASLPLIIMKKLGPRNKEKAENYYFYDTLKNGPNPQQTRFEWVSLTSVHQNLWGAGISEIEFDSKGMPVALWPLPPWRVKPFFTNEHELAYKVSLPNGTIKVLNSFQVVVFTTLQVTRGKWLSPIGVHRETMGYSLALREFGAKTFGQGTNPAGVLKFQGPWPEELAEDSKRKEFVQQYAGLSNSHRLMLLSDGADFSRVGMPPQDAQYIDTQKLQIAEIGRIFNVPLHLIQMLEKSTSFGKGLEELSISFVTYSLLPYLVQWEQQLNKKVLFNKKLYIKFVVDALLRGKLLDRYAAYNIGRNGGWFSANDILDKEDMNSIGEQGDKYLQPKAMGDLSTENKEDNNNNSNKTGGEEDEDE